MIIPRPIDERGTKKSEFDYEASCRMEQSAISLRWLSQDLLGKTGTQNS